jgi:diguanylate cyclase
MTEPRDALNLVTLAFRDRRREVSYFQDSLPRFRLQVRIALLMGITLYFLVGILDPWFIAGSERATAWWYRASAMAYPLLVLGLTFHPRFGRLGQLPVALVGFAPAIGVVGVMSLMSVEGLTQYYAGFVVVVFWTYLLLGVGFVHALAVNMISTAIFFAGLVLFREVPPYLLGSSAFFLVSANLIGAGAAYLLEYQRRLLFLRNAQLELERERQKFRALHDNLTGLPNRELLLDRLEQAISSAQRDGRKCAGLYLDLDGFKPINDAHGHAAGDQVLKTLARRLSGLLRGADTVARLGGDEFFILAHGVETLACAELVAGRVLKGVAAPVDIDGGATVQIGVSIGICVFPYPDCTAHDIIHRSDHAMYSVKRSGKQGFAFSDTAVDVPARAS